MGEHPVRAAGRLLAIDQGKLHRRSITPRPGDYGTMLTGTSGNKKDNVTVIYTPWSNLHKDGSMAVGQVGFTDPKKVPLQASDGRAIEARVRRLMMV